MADIIIRPAYKEDIRGMHGIEQKSFSVPWSYDAFAENFYNNCSYYALAECDGEIIGFGGMQVILDEAHIMNVAVDSDFRRCGAATEILHLLIDEAKERHAEKMFLEVRSGNVPARSLYLKLGFQQIGIRKKYYSDNDEDAIIMLKLL